MSHGPSDLADSSCRSLLREHLAEMDLPRRETDAAAGGSPWLPGQGADIRAKAVRGGTAVVLGSDILEGQARHETPAVPK